MKNSKKLYGGLSVMALVAMAIVTASSASAYRGDPTVQGPYHSEEKHTAMTQAFEANNYEDWKELMRDRGRVTQMVNADNFAQFAKAHQLALQGDLEGAKAIRAELGLGLRNGDSQGKGFGHRGQFDSKNSK